MKAPLFLSILSSLSLLGWGQRPPVTRTTPTPVVRQSSREPCSPNVSNVRGSLTINISGNCSGLNSALVAKLNEKLRRFLTEFPKWQEQIHSNLLDLLKIRNDQLAEKNEQNQQLSSKIMALEAELEWLSRKAEDLSKEQANDDESTRRARSLVKGGDLNAAIQLLNRQLSILTEEGINESAELRTGLPYTIEGDDAEAKLRRRLAINELRIDDAAERHFELGEALELNLQPQDALQQYATAWRLRPGGRYGAAYGSLLYKKHQNELAEDVLSKALDEPGCPHDSVQPCPTNHVVITCAGMTTAHYVLAHLYRETQRFKQAEAVYLSMFVGCPLSTRTIESVDELATFYADTQQWSEAEAAFKAEVRFYRGFGNDAPPIYRASKGLALYNLAILYKHTNQSKESEEAYEDALQIYRDLARERPASYQAIVEAIVNALGEIRTGKSSKRDAGTPR